MIRGAEQGFSLIEALVALAVVTLALLAIYDLQLRLTNGQMRSEAALARAAMQRNAVLILGDLNPMEQPTGSFALAGGRTLRWAATPLTRPRPNQTLGRAQGRHLVQLYAVHAEVLDAQGRRQTTVELDRVGWRPRPAGAAPPLPPPSL